MPPNPGSILKFTYGGDKGSALAVSDGTETGAAAPGAPAAGGPEECENSANRAQHRAPRQRPRPFLWMRRQQAITAILVIGQCGPDQVIATCSGCRGVSGQGSAVAVLADNAKLADAGPVEATAILWATCALWRRAARPGYRHMSSFIRNS